MVFSSWFLNKAVPLFLVGMLSSSCGHSEACDSSKEEVKRSGVCMRDMLKRKAKMAGDALSEARALHDKNDISAAIEKFSYVVDIIGDSYIDSVSLDDSDLKLAAARAQVKAGRFENALTVYERIATDRMAKLQSRIEKIN